MTEVNALASISPGKGPHGECTIDGSRGRIAERCPPWGGGRE